jgi:hypothetical protein
MFGNQNSWEVSAAKKDFECYTLLGVPSLLGKLKYLEELRSDMDHQYAHWGMERIFGTDQTQRALEEVHVLLSRELLTMRTPDLVKDANVLETRPEVPATILHKFAGLRAPVQLTAAEKAHFEVTVETLRALQDPVHRAA